MTAAGAVTRDKVSFRSGDADCAAWFYPGSNGACVIMAGGLAVTKEPGTDRFAERFNQAGYSALAFDYRRFGESGGEPRQIAKIGEQLEDWQAAIAFARTLPGVNPEKIAVWGFSASGGHIFIVAARNPSLGAAITQAPLVDGPAVTPNAARHQTPLGFLRFSARAVRDAIGLALGREPLLVPLAGEPGVVTSLTSPDARNGDPALNPGDAYPEWQQQIAASSALRVGFYRPGRFASKIDCPLLVVAYSDDGVAPPGPAVRAAKRAPRGELAEIPGGHYGAFLAGHDATTDAELKFLNRHLGEI